MVQNGSLRSRVQAPLTAKHFFGFLGPIRLRIQAPSLMVHQVGFSPDFHNKKLENGKCAKVVLDTRGHLSFLYYIQIQIHF